MKSQAKADLGDHGLKCNGIAKININTEIMSTTRIEKVMKLLITFRCIDSSR